MNLRILTESTILRIDSHHYRRDRRKKLTRAAVIVPRKPLTRRSFKSPPGGRDHSHQGNQQLNFEKNYTRSNEIRIDQNHCWLRKKRGSQTCSSIGGRFAQEKTWPLERTQLFCANRDAVNKLRIRKAGLVIGPSKFHRFRRKKHGR